jgi:hypothetical protein
VRQLTPLLGVLIGGSPVMSLSAHVADEAQSVRTEMGCAIRQMLSWPWQITQSSRGGMILDRRC